VFADLEAIRQANARGHQLVGAVSCCPLAMEFTLHSPYTFEGLSSWKPALGKKDAEFRRVLSSREFRQGIRQELSTKAHFRLFNGEWDKVTVVQSVHAELEQRSIAAIAKSRAKDPLDCILDLALEENLDTVFSALLLNSDEEAVGRMLRHPCTMVSLSDAGAHLTFFNDAGFGLHLLGHWVRERGALTLPEAAWRLTGQPAGVFGVRGRGALKPGFAADLLLFDPADAARVRPARRPAAPRRLGPRGPRRMGQRHAHRRRGRVDRRRHAAGKAPARILGVARARQKYPRANSALRFSSGSGVVARRLQPVARFS
jgi:N-acyl-D-aspartate/D-glutamate deacylase